MITQANFTANLFSTGENFSTEQIHINLQYFSTANNQWENFFNEPILPIDNSINFSAKVNLGENPAWQTIIGGIDSGGFPSLRLIGQIKESEVRVSLNENTEITYVLSYNHELNFIPIFNSKSRARKPLSNSKKLSAKSKTTLAARLQEGDFEMNVDFGDIWILDAKTIQRLAMNAAERGKTSVVIATNFKPSGGGDPNCQSDLQNARNELANLQSAFGRLQVDYNTSLNETNRLTNLVASLNASNVTLNGRITELETQVSKLNNDLNVANANVLSLNQSLAKLTNDLTTERALTSSLQQTIQEKNTVIDQLNQTLTARNTEISTLNANLIQLNQLNSNLTTDLTNERNVSNGLRQTIQEKNTAIEQLNQTLTAKNTEINALQASNSQLTVQNTALNASLNASRSQVTSLTNDLQQKTNALTALQTDYNSAQATITQNGTVISQLRSDIVTKDATIQSLNTSINEKDVRIIGLNQDLIKKTEEANENYGRLVGKQAELREQRTMQANEVYSNVINEINLANQNLGNSKYQLSNMSLDLKVLVQNDSEGLKLQLVDDMLAEGLNGSALSNIRIDVKSTDLNPTNTNEAKLPDLSGLTETEVRKRLANYGLKLKPVYQFSSTKVIGQSFKQHPAADTDIIEGSTITVMFAKEKNKYN